MYDIYIYICIYRYIDEINIIFTQLPIVQGSPFPDFPRGILLGVRFHKTVGFTASEL